MWAIIFWVALGVIGLATVSLLMLFIRRGGPVAPTAGGSSKKINFVKWFFIVLFGWLLYSIGSCIFTLPRTYSRTAQKIAQEGREWKEALYEVARKATSPAEKQKLPKDEPEEAPSPLSRVEIVDWWMEHGQPKSADGWKEIGTEVNFHFGGNAGLQSVINTAFYEGYELHITDPTYGLANLESAFTSSILVELVDSSKRNVSDAVMGRIGGRGLMGLGYAVIGHDTGLVWCRIQKTSVHGSGQKPKEKFGFTAVIKEPRDNEPLVWRKQGSVRFAYQRDFRLIAGKAPPVRCCTLPFQMIGQATGKPVTVPVDFDIDVTLARLPESGETTVTETRPNPQDLDRPLVMLELVCGETVIYERHINEWHVRLSSDKDIRPYLDDPKKYPYGELRFKCGMPVGVHVAIQIGGTRR